MSNDLKKTVGKTTRNSGNGNTLCRKTISFNLIESMVSKSKRQNKPLRIGGTEMYVKHTNTLNNIMRYAVYSCNPTNSINVNKVCLYIDTENPFEINGFDRLVKFAKEQCGVEIREKQVMIKKSGWGRLLDKMYFMLYTNDKIDSDCYKN